MSEEFQILVASGSGIQTIVPQVVSASPQATYLDVDGQTRAYSQVTSVIVYNGQTSNGLVATSNKTIDVYGVVSSTTVGLSGTMIVEYGGSAYSTLVNSGTLYLYNGGKAVSTSMSAGGIYVRGGFMDAAKIDGGVVYVSAGGSARYLEANSGGQIIVSSGGVVSSSYVNQNGHLSANRGAQVVSTLVKSGGYLYANDGVNVMYTTVRNGGNLHVRTGGSVTNANINSGGNFYVMGGTAYVRGVNAEQGAKLSMGIGAQTDIQGTSAGSAFAYSSVVRGVDVHSNLTLTLREGGSAVAVTVTSGGQLNATSGGTAFSTTIQSRGVLNLDDYGVAVSTTVNANGHIYATDGGTAVSTINRGGYINVSEGGSALSTTLESNSWLDLFNGGSAIATIINGGHLMVSSGGMAFSTTFNAGWLKVSNGGTAMSTTLTNDVWLDVCDGGTAVSTMINSGHLVVSNSGTAAETIVNPTGQLVLSNGGTARGMIVHSGGTLLASGGVLQGEVVLGGTMTLSSLVNAANANIKFDVSSRTTADKVIVNDISLLNASNYFVTVNASQSNGQYMLAGNAAAFNKSITLSVKNTSQNVQLTRGVTQTIGNKSYTVDVINGNLCLAVEQKPVLTIRVDNKNMIYGYATPSLTYSFTGDLSYGHTLSVSLDLNINNASITASGHIKAGTYANAITAVATVRDTGGNIVTGKYVINYDFGDLIVDKRGLSVTIDKQSATYGEALPNIEDLQYSYDATQLAQGDVFNATLKYNTEVTGAQSSFSGGGSLRSGLYSHAIVEDYVSPDIAANYRINWNYGALRINPKQVTVGYIANDKIYDGTTDATRKGNFITNGILNGDAVRIFDNNVTYSFSNKNVGENKTVTANGDITYIGADAANYSLVFDKNAVADITQRPVTIGFTANDKTYDGTVDATRDELVMGEIIEGDEVVLDDSAIMYCFDDGNVSMDKTVTANGFDAASMLSGDDLHNYVITFDDTAVADITPISVITIHASDQSMIYGDDAPSLTYTCDGDLAGGHVLSVSLDLDIDDDALTDSGHMMAGTYVNAITAVATIFDAIGNDVTAGYIINYDFGDLVVEKRTIAVTINAQSMTYGDELPDLEGQYSYNPTVLAAGDTLALELSYQLDDAEKSTSGNLQAGLYSGCIVVDSASALIENNYELLANHGSLSVASREVSIGFIANDKVYDGMINATRDELVMGEIIDGDDVVFDDSTIMYRFDDGDIGTDKIVTANGFDATTMLSGDDLQNYDITFVDTAVADIIAIPLLEDLIGDESGLSWSISMAVSGYVVEYSQDDFSTIAIIETATTGLTHYNMETGTWQWRVRPVLSSEWSAGEDFTVTTNSTEATIFEATTDDVTDAFFVQSQGIWNHSYQAQHVGVGTWKGTEEIVELDGKNQITDFFAGSDDASILLLTDDENGDALFIDDVYSAFPEGIDAQARIAKIDEIRAGAGEDIVDLTSQRFDYVGSGMTVHGGLGDDVIWANDGNNTLFGDAGHDRLVGAGGNDVVIGGNGDDSMYGGGGNDIFAFGGDWGNDNVEQLADGKVTLWFDDGSLDNWDAAALTYRDGDNSVKVSGVGAENITLKFGDDGSQQYSKLLELGAFDEFSSERIFESRNNRGMLA